jgi:hypothetical protein
LLLTTRRRSPTPTFRFDVVMTPIHDAALAAYEAGLSVVPPAEDGSKKPLSTWKRYQHFRATSDQLNEWYGPHTGLGAVLGQVSGNVEAFEFDDRTVYEQFVALARQSGLGDLIQKLEEGYVEDTPSGGVHWLSHCEKIAGNTKLATRPKRPEEERDPKDKTKTLIETRGEGGYIVLAPSNGRVHPTGGAYRLRAGSFATIPTITPDERRELHQLAKAFHQSDGKERASFTKTAAAAADAGGRPGDDFNARATWADVLTGWTAVFTTNGETHWRRPGKKIGTSATTNHGGLDLLIVFSTSTAFVATTTDAKQGYTKFAAYALLNHGGDFAAAARDLASKGYGDVDDHNVMGEFHLYFITQLGSKDGGRRITMVGCDETFPPHFQTYEAFRQYFCDTRIKVGTKWTTRAELWLQNRQHRKYADVQFLPPPLDVPPGVLNLWNGFAVQADPDPHPEQRCALFLAHVRQVICAGEDTDVAEFLLDVLAKKVQEPSRLTEVSIAIRGGQGVGKNTLTDYYGGLFGRHAATVDKQELVTGRFNAVLSSKLVLTLDEAMWPGHKEFIGALKSLVTNAFLMVERKGIDPVRERNFVQTFVLTNGTWAWPTELGDRRALIVDVSDAQKGKTPYFDALYRERDHGGLAALLAYLQQRTITHDLRLVPHTKARDTQVALTDDDPVRSMWFDMLHRGLTWPESEIWDDFISTKDFEEYYAEWCRATRQKPLPVKLLLQRWHDMLPPTFGHPKQRRLIDRELILGARRRGGWPRDKDGIPHLPDPVMRRGTAVPDLDSCRRHYAEQVEQRAIEWPGPAEPVPEAP